MNVLLTGTTKGIGLAILKKLSSQGNKCTVINRSPVLNCEECNMKKWNYDLSDLSQIEEVCNKIANEGEFEVLINNAGAGTPCEFEKLTIDQINKEINLNLKAPMMLIKAVLPYMKQIRFGRIVNISSITGKRGTPYLFTYSAAKAGLNSLTQSLAGYLRNTGITINSICPGGVETQTSILGRSEISKLLNYDDDEYQKSMVDKMGLGRLIKPEEVADFVSYLVEVNHEVITGQSINVCGNMEVI